MTKEYTETLTEVSEILKYMNEEEVIKIPKEIRNFIDDNKSDDYKFYLVPHIPFLNQNIKRETLAFLGLLSLNYWCESEEERKKLYNSFEENEKNYESKIREIYNPDNLFAKVKKTNEEGKEEKQLVKYQRKTLFSRIIEKIRRLFNK